MGDHGKKNLFFTQNFFVDRDSNPRPLREKHLPNQLSHRGVVIELNLKLGATHISLARFLVAPIYDWVPLPISQSLCVFLCVTVIVKKKISKKSRGIEPQMSAWVGTAVPPVLFRTFNLIYYFTKKMLSTGFEMWKNNTEMAKTGEGLHPFETPTIF